MSVQKKTLSKKFKGLIASDGMALGRAYILRPFEIKVSHRQLSPEKIEAELSRFEEAIAKSRQEIEKLLEHSRLADELEAIFEAQFLLLEDPMLIGESREKIRLLQVNAEWALQGEIRILKDFLLKSENSLFQERAADLEDVGMRILRNLMNINEESFAEMISKHEGPLILIGDAIAPSIFLQIPMERLEGIACQSGGITSHLAILSKSHNIPALLHVEGLLKHSSLIDKKPVFLDCMQGELIQDPGKREQEIYRNYLVERAKTQATSVFSPIKTIDNHSIELWVNLDDLESAGDERVQELSGVGLFRTEFLYLRDPRPLSTGQEHSELYLNILKKLKPKPVHFRLLDVGDDKPLPRQIMARGRGLRGIRFLLSNWQILVSQVKSILLAVSKCEYPNKQCRILLPMVNSLEEIQSVVKMLEEIRSELETRTFKALPEMPLGIMLETPAALEMADVFSKHVSFFCLGSNDLGQLNLAIDREEGLDSEELFYHPAFFRQFKRIVENSMAPVSLCGGITARLDLLPLLLGLGIEHFSVPISSIVSCARVLEGSKYKECQELAKRALEAESTTELRRLLSAFSSH